MFRKLSRKNKQLSHEECCQILLKEPRGVLSVLGDNGYPYGMPMNYLYNVDDGSIYFHCGKTGHRIDSVKKCEKVSFCVFDGGVPNDDGWSSKVKSVIIFGRIEIIDDLKTVVDICNKLSRKFTDDSTYIENEIKAYAKATIVLKLKPDHMCGKVVDEK